jgi:hypothetical protein
MGVLVNADVGQGWVRLEVLDDQGQPIPGFTREQARPITGNHLRTRAAWIPWTDAADLRGAPHPIEAVHRKRQSVFNFDRWQQIVAQERLRTCHDQS